MTERLYYRDSLLREFDAHVLSCEREGERWRIVLDRTAFYPTSGGQPHDLGRLGDARVLEVADAPDEKVIHYASAAVEPGLVRGEVDWPRRFDHMQQHTGQHLLSAVFLDLFKFPTVSFHLGREVSTIDLEAPSVSARHLLEAERRTNEIIFDDRVVSIRFGTAAELAEAGVRKTVDRDGVLRVVEIDGVDRQPCGGTHLARTGQAGLLLIRRIERRRDAWRLEYVCGFRALATARGDFATLAKTADILGCGLPEVPGGVAKVLDERGAQHGALKRLQERLSETEARALLARSSTSNGVAPRIISAAIDDATPGYVNLLAARLAAETGVIALLASKTSGHVVFAQTRGGSCDVGALLRDNIKKFGGKGGGSRDFAQGSVPNPSNADQLLYLAKETLAAK